MAGISDGLGIKVQGSVLNGRVSMKLFLFEPIASTRDCLVSSAIESIKLSTSSSVKSLNLSLTASLSPLACR